MLAAQAERQARIAELGALFAAADEVEDEAEVEAEDDAEAGGVLPSAVARQLKEENREDRARLKELLDQMRGLAGELFDAGQRAGVVGTRERRAEFTAGLSLRAPDLAPYDRLLALHRGKGALMMGPCIGGRSPRGHHGRAADRGNHDGPARNGWPLTRRWPTNCAD